MADVAEGLGRITVIAGHYGSGKTELAVNLAMDAAARLAGWDTAGLPPDQRPYDSVAVCDLDIANPYFRSRERAALLREHGIDLISNAFEQDITEDLPAVSARINAPLQNPRCRVFLDVGGDQGGARVLIQFRDLLLGDESRMLCVLNANRPETSDLPGALAHLRWIGEETGIPFKGLVNNTHLLSETSPEDILRGHRLCREASRATGIPLLLDCCREDLVPALSALAKESGEDADLKLFPLRLYMRPSWLL